MSPLKELSRTLRREFGSCRRRRRFDRIERAKSTDASAFDKLRAFAPAWVLCFGSILLFGNALHFLTQHTPETSVGQFVGTQENASYATSHAEETHEDCPICEFFALCRTLVLMGASVVFLSLVAFRFLAASLSVHANQFLHCFNGRAPPVV